MNELISILLVDDESRNLDALEAILDEPTYRLLRADDAQTALRLLLENDVAAIVLDIKMPGVSGFELAQLIKGTKKFRQIPIVFLTAYLIDDQDVIAGYGAGAVDYLTKPVNPQILRHKIAVFADLFRKTRALADLNDTLERRVLERTAELEMSEGALRESHRQKDMFLATLAHELRNPLAPLRSGLDLLRHDPSPEMREKTLAAMNRQVDHLVRLVDDLLDVSRISRGRIELRKELVELSSVIDRAIEMAAPLLVRSGQQATVVSDGPVPALVDPSRIGQIIGNLLSNASKHSPPGMGVTVELRCEGDRATIRVVDRGVGIPSDQIQRVFDMFTTVDRPVTRNHSGLGIGLALSRQIAELHGGTLTAASGGDGQGSTFTLLLPTGLSGSAVPVAAVTNQTSAPIAPLRIVIVEDNDDAGETLFDLLRRFGHDVRLARNGEDGIAAILETQPDLVLCDIGLPDMDGIEVCRRVRLEAGRPPLMVALTGWGMEDDRKRTTDAGFRHHLVKPVAPEQLRRVLSSVREPI